MEQEHRIKHRARPAWRSLRPSLALVGVASLIWLIVRTGSKPSRLGYPCQRMAAANVSTWLGVAAVGSLIREGVRRWAAMLSAAVVVASVLLLSCSSAGPSAVVGPGDGKGVVMISEHRAADGGVADILVAQGTNGADNGFERLIELMRVQGTSFYSMISPDDVVLIKVNSQWDQRGGTNTDLVKAIVQSVVSHPDGFTGEVVIVDNGQAQYGSAGRGGSLDWEQNNAVDPEQSIRQVADSFSESARVSAFLWDPLTRTEVNEYSSGDVRDGYVLGTTRAEPTGLIVSYPKFKTRYGTAVSFKLGVWNAATRSYDHDGLKVINVPVLKTHMIYGVTAGVKHYMGVVSDKLTRGVAHRSVGRGGMGAQMVGTRLPVLNVIDAIWINAKPGAGPASRYSQATRTNIVAASTDPIALDYWAAKNILVPAARSQGYRNTSSIDPDNTSRGSFGDWLRLSMGELKKAGHEVTIEADKINVYVSTPEAFDLNRQIHP